jgi:dolichol-phosphate mannosyltransferase
VVNWPLSRVLLSYFASVYVKFITGMKIHDATAGFICYKRKVLEEINLDTIRFVGYAFQIEIQNLLQKNFKLLRCLLFTDRTKGSPK